MRGPCDTPGPRPKARDTHPKSELNKHAKRETGAREKGRQVACPDCTDMWRQVCESPTSQLLLLRPGGPPARDHDFVGTRGAREVSEPMGDYVHAAVRVEVLYLHHYPRPALHARSLVVNVKRVVPYRGHALFAVRCLGVSVRASLEDSPVLAVVDPKLTADPVAKTCTVLNLADQVNLQESELRISGNDQTGGAQLV